MKKSTADTAKNTTALCTIFWNCASRSLITGVIAESMRGQIFWEVVHLTCWTTAGVFILLVSAMLVSKLFEDNQMFASLFVSYSPPHFEYQNNQIGLKVALIKTKYTCVVRMVWLMIESWLHLCRNRFSENKNPSIWQFVQFLMLVSKIEGTVHFKSSSSIQKPVCKHYLVGDPILVLEILVRGFYNSIHHIQTWESVEACGISIH